MKRRNEQELSAIDLAKIISADFETGNLFWKAREPGLFGVENHNPWNAKYAGKSVYLRPRGDGYFQVRIFGREFTFHRVVMALSTGRWAPEMVDHINGDRSDNRLVNLREASPSDNARNRGRSKNNRTGRIGVNLAPRAGAFTAAIVADGKRTHLGTFDSFERACAARAEAERDLGFHANHGAVR